MTLNCVIERPVAVAPEHLRIGLYKAGVGVWLIPLLLHYGGWLVCNETAEQWKHSGTFVCHLLQNLKVPSKLWQITRPSLAIRKKLDNRILFGVEY